MLAVMGLVWTPGQAHLADRAARRGAHHPKRRGVLDRCARDFARPYDARMCADPVASEQDVVDLLTDLVSTPSVSPEIAGGTGEAAVGAKVASFADRCGATVEYQEALPGRSNVICTLEAGADAPTLMLEAHMDTVALGAMPNGHDPWVDDAGLLHGRGACDTKGSLAAMLLTFRKASEQADRPCALVLAATVDEETGSTGADTLAESDVAADGAIVGEPTSLEIVRVHRGGRFWRITTTGKSAHSSRPDLGVNAIYHMADVIQVLREEFTRRLADRRHPLVGASTFSAGRIRAGTSFNVVPAECELVFDRRFLPTERLEDVDAELGEVLDIARARNPELRVEVEAEVVAGSLDTPEQAAVVQALNRACETVTGQATIAGAPYGSDAASLAAAGIPSVLCGPGDIAVAHSEDEWVPVAEVVQAADVYFQTWRTFADTLAGAPRAST